MGWLIQPGIRRNVLNVTTINKRSGLTLFTVAFAFLLPVAFSPSVHAVFWAPKAALVLLAAAVGFPRLLILAKRPSNARLPARASLSFVAVASVSTLFANNHTTAIFGHYIWGTGLIFIISLPSIWAIGVSLDEDGRKDVTQALLAGVAVNVVFSLLEMVGDLSAFELARYDGRSIGLMGNPVHLGALVAAGLALSIPWRGRRLWPWLILIGSIAAAVEVSGSRSALVALAVVLIGSARSKHYLGWRRLAAVMVVVLLGLTGGVSLTQWGGGVSVSQRITEANGGGGVVPRFSMWWATRHAIIQNPLLGSGPSSYLEATSRYRTPSVARAFGADRYFSDAHNLVIEYATTTGILGLSALLLWLTWAWRRSGGPLRLFATALLVVGLVEPQWVGTTPLALLALGMALTSTAEKAPTFAAPLSTPIRGLTAALILVATTASGVFLVGGFHLDQAVLDFNRHHADRSLSLLPHWSQPATVRARIETFEGRSEKNPTKLALALHWQQEAILRTPTDPSTWLTLADAAASEGRPKEASEAYKQVLRLNPMSTRACNGLARLALASRNPDSAKQWMLRSLTINPEQPSVRQAFRNLE